MLLSSIFTVRGIAATLVVDETVSRPSAPLHPRIPRFRLEGIHPTTIVIYLLLRHVRHYQSTLVEGEPYDVDVTGEDDVQVSEKKGTSADRKAMCKLVSRD